jgi:hypothetical protein
LIYGNQERRDENQDNQNTHNDENSTELSAHVDLQLGREPPLRSISDV